jgi:hypothetical protein
LDLIFKTPWPCKWPLHPRWSLQGGDLLVAASRNDPRKCNSLDEDDDFGILLENIILSYFFIIIWGWGRSCVDDPVNSTDVTTDSSAFVTSSHRCLMKWNFSQMLMWMRDNLAS